MHKAILIMKLRTVIFVITVCLIFYSSAYCEVSIKSFGLELGPNFGLADFENTQVDHESKWGRSFIVGCYLEISLTSKVSIIQGIRSKRVRVGYEREQPPFPVKEKCSLRHDFLSLPLLFRFRLLKNVVNLDLGPELAFLGSCTEECKYYNYEQDTYSSVEIDVEDIKEVVFSVYASLGIDGSNWGMPITISFGYSHGLSGIFDSKHVNFDWKIREYIVTISHYYSF